MVPLLGWAVLGGWAVRGCEAVLGEGQAWVLGWAGQAKRRGEKVRGPLCKTSWQGSGPVSGAQLGGPGTGPGHKYRVLGEEVGTLGVSWARTQVWGSQCPQLY